MFEKAPELSIDKEGKWYADGVHMFRLDIVKLFSEHLVSKDSGDYEVLWDGKTYPVKIEDVPFVIDDLIVEEEEIKIRLTDSRIMDFTPKELKMQGDILYISLFFEGLDTRFSRKAQWQLSDYITEKDGKLMLVFSKNKFDIL